MSKGGGRKGCEQGVREYMRRGKGVCGRAHIIAPGGGPERTKGITQRKAVHHDGGDGSGPREDY